MPITMSFNGTSATEQFRRGMTLSLGRMKKATLATSKEVAAEIQQQGRANISSAGRFGDRWRKAFTASVTGRGVFGANIIVNFSIPYWKVFEYGQTIRGRPLLWIPLSGAIVATGRRMFYAVSRKGTPLMFDQSTKEPVLFGIKQIRLKKRFNLVKIARQVSSKIPAIYRKHFNGR